MKVTKILALAAVAVMGCTAFYGCGEGPGTSQMQTASVVGSWKVKGMSDGTGKVKSVDEFIRQNMASLTVTTSGVGIDVNNLSKEEREQMEQMLAQAKAKFDQMRMQFREDGTFTAMLGSTTPEGTYVLIGDQLSMTANDETEQATYDAQAGTITLEGGGMYLVFERG